MSGIWDAGTQQGRIWGWTPHEADGESPVPAHRTEFGRSGEVLAAAALPALGTAGSAEEEHRCRCTGTS